MSAAKRKPVAAKGETFHCYRCDRHLPREAFNWRASGSRFSACKECNRTMAKERHARIGAGLPAEHPEFNPHGEDEE